MKKNSRVSNHNLQIISAYSYILLNFTIQKSEQLNILHNIALNFIIQKKVSNYIYFTTFFQMPPKPATIGVVFLTENIPSCDNKIKLAPLNIFKEKKLVYFPEFPHDVDTKDLIQDFLLKLPQVIPYHQVGKLLSASYWGLLVSVIIEL